MTIAIYSLASSLHSEIMPKAENEPFIQAIVSATTWAKFLFPSSLDGFGTHDIDLIYIRTGGTEGLFKSAFCKDGVLTLPDGPVKLLTSGDSNSLAASMEILSFLRQNGHSGEILHGSAQYISGKLTIPDWKFDGQRAGVIGRPSDWLISSNVDPEVARENMGVELVNIPIEELVDDVKVSGDIYSSLKAIVAKYNLSALTVRCFDLLGTVHDTGCLALAKLNAEGIPASCEGDVPALLTMMVAHKVTGTCGFQANPSRIDPEKGELVFAHCTVPLDMVRSYRYDTHFESGIGTAIKGELPEGPVTIFKIGPDARTKVCFHGELLRNLSEKNLCRTQVAIHCPDAVKYFFTAPVGNHHIIIPGTWNL